MSDESLLKKAGGFTGFGTGAVVGLVAGSARGLWGALQDGNWKNFESTVDETIDTCAEEGEKIGKDLAPVGAGIIAAAIVGGARDKPKKLPPKS